MSNPNSIVIQRIAYAWALTFIPHVIKLGILGAAGYKWDNAVGRHNMLKEPKSMKVADSALNRAKRADAAHQNGNESFPLFAAGVLSAIVTGVDSATIDSYTKLYLTLRVAYIVLFVFGGSNQVLAGIRTIVWGTGVWTSISLLLQSSKLLAVKGL